MTLDAEVIGVETMGDVLAVRVQATGRPHPEWRPMYPMTLQFADTAPHRRAMHVGRQLVITIRPKT